MTLDQLLTEREQIATISAHNDRAIGKLVADALERVLGQLDQLCAKDDAEQLMSQLLRKFNAVTGLSGWSDPKQLH